MYIGLGRKASVNIISLANVSNDLEIYRQTIKQTEYMFKSITINFLLIIRLNN